MLPGAWCGAARTSPSTIPRPAGFRLLGVRDRHGRTGTAASGDVTATAPHRFAAHVVGGPPDEIPDDDVARRYGVTGAPVPGLPQELTAHGQAIGASRRGRHDEVRYDAVVPAGGEPVLQVHSTALFRLDAA